MLRNSPPKVLSASGINIKGYRRIVELHHARFNFRQVQNLVDKFLQAHVVFFYNLIGNATKFTAKGSISFGYKLKEKEIVFHVADTGSGISDDKIDKIFDRFIMANNQVQGTGLGLSISKIIVEKLGGKIAVQSKMETGTTFTFTLPYISANGDMKWEEKLTPASIKDNNRTSHQEMTILVAEDYQSNYDL